MAVALLEFDQPIAELEAKSEELRHVTSESEVNIQDEINRLQAKSRQLTTSIFASLTPWQISQLARHPQRPYTLDYLALVCDEFHELAGDRAFAGDGAIVGVCAGPGCSRCWRGSRCGRSRSTSWRWSASCSLFWRASVRLATMPRSSAYA